MYKAVIFFFSGTGSTWWVADRIQKQLDACGINADIVPMDSVDAKKADWWIKTADLVLFGWPVYDGDMPTPVKAFVDNLLVVEKGKHIHTFCTTTGFSADGAVRYCRRFADKGLIIDSTAHLKLPFRWYSLNPRRRQPGEKALQRIFAACENSVDSHIKALMEGKARVRGRRLAWLGALQRLPYRLVKERRQNRLSVDEERCTHCGACAELCPVNNIRFETIPHFLGHCAQCLRCCAFCPACAIKLDGRSRGVCAGRPYSLPDKRLKPYMLIK
jgi:flavodoxin/NAD-dependent dihydropyrimidine dehydrogenase PreA subunit